MIDSRERTLSKVPEVTLGFWLIKILATTLGETGGDTVTMTLDWGYLAGHSRCSPLLLVGLVIAQIRAKRFHPVLYWATIVASTTFGTTLADFADRSLGIGYTGGSTLLLACLAAVLALWYRTEGTVSVEHGLDAAGRGLLLGDHHLLADARHRARRLARRHRRARLRGRRRRLRGGAGRRRRSCTTGRRSRGSACSGRLSS